MFAWLGENLGTILITLALAGLLAGIVWSMRKGKKKGKHACCGSCGHCAMGASCCRKQGRG